jgi:hypothetical protein
LKEKEDNDMISIAKRAASLAELIAAGTLIVALLQTDAYATAIGGVFMAITFGITWLIDRRERRTQ